MSGTALGSGQSLTGDQKHAALEAVLHSQTFARTDQLKCFLKYVCALEDAGRGHELTEYLIGIEALGRPASYSPGDDSVVRTRAHALRKKLQEFYEHEQPDAALRIEFLKGSYCPHYVQSRPQHEATVADPAGEPLAPELGHPPIGQEDELPAGATSRRTWMRSSWLSFSAGVVVTALLGGTLFWTMRAEPAAPDVAHVTAPIVAEAWGPLLAPNSDVMVCVANPPAFSVLPGSFSPPPPQDLLAGERPLPRQLYGLYATRYPEKANLSLAITTNATYWGDVLGALTAFKTLSAGGVTPQLFPEMVTTMPTLRRRNIVLVGAPAYSAAVAHYLEQCPLNVDFLKAIVAPATEQSSPASYALKRDARQRLTRVFGLITVLPGESSVNHETRVVIFSGVNSAGAQAAAEFFSSPEHLLELKNELKKAGFDTFPPAYQVVVSAETDDSILLSFRYETFRIVAPPGSH